jgi:hypothetical protein
MIPNFLLLIVSIGGSPLNPNAHISNPAANSRSAGGALCAVRCVDFILQLYERDRPSFHELVREMAASDPDSESSISMLSIQHSLENRNVGTLAIYLPPAATLAWDHAAVVHFEDSKYPMGHFAIWLPTSDESHVHLWPADGAAAAVSMSRAEFDRHRTGYVLLASPTPIQPNSGLIKPNHPSRALLPLAGLCVLIATVVLIIVEQLRKRLVTRHLFRHPSSSSVGSDACLPSTTVATKCSTVLRDQCSEDQGDLQ